MSRRKKIDSSILGASKQFDAQTFVEIIKGEFSDFPDHRYNKKHAVYPIWYICLVILCGFFCGCNTIEEIAEYALLQNTWFKELLGKSYSSPSYSTLWWFVVRTQPDALKQYFKKWFVKLPDQLNDQLLALDGKRLKSANFLSHSLTLKKIRFYDTSGLVLRNRFLGFGQGGGFQNSRTIDANSRKSRLSDSRLSLLLRKVQQYGFP